jgi:CRP/FNR family transcriptional regulator, cyclic AMP receptor protein
VGQCANEGKIRTKSTTTAAHNPSKSFDPKIFLAKVAAGRTITPYQDGQVVFSQGGKADSVYYVQKGNFRLTVVSKQGKEATIAILNRRQLLR